MSGVMAAPAEPRVSGSPTDEKRSTWVSRVMLRQETTLVVVILLIGVLTMLRNSAFVESSNLTAVEHIKTGTIGEPRVFSSVFTQQIQAGNTRLDADLLAWQMNHCETKVLITDSEFAPVMQQALATLKQLEGAYRGFDHPEADEASPVIAALVEAAR